ncbi:MAG: histidinol-phosphate transaminase [Ignavibacteriaceae bacterium]|nr:histidinol-phosphate transaminase [Ignavibacteriaceae bacterium]
MITIPEFVQNLVPYKAGKSIDELAREKGLTKIVKLASNENPLGPSPKSMGAMSSYINESHRYADPLCHNLVQHLSQINNLAPEMIFAASGSDAILQYIIMTCSNEGDELLTSEGSFIGWYVNSDKLGRKSVKVPLTKDYKYDLDSISKAITDKTKIIYLANPNNPTGTIFSSKELESFFETVPSNVLVVLDEAYTMYVDNDLDFPNGLNYLRENLIVTRTFSKSYGLAGLRVGYAFGHPELIKSMFKVKLSFEPTSLSQVAAIAAISDDEFIRETIELNKRSLSMLRDKLDSLEIKYTDSAANFLMMIFESEEQARKFTIECLNRGLILRHVDTFGIPEGVRINSGTDEETEFAVEVIEQVWELIN